MDADADAGGFGGKVAGDIEKDTGRVCIWCLCGEALEGCFSVVVCEIDDELVKVGKLEHCAECNGGCGHLFIYTHTNRWV